MLNKVKFANIPTTIQHVTQLEYLFENKINFYLKFEGALDKNHFGTKTRAIEYVINKALNEKYSRIILDGRITSNCCACLSYYGNRYNLGIDLVIKDPKPKVISGNHKIMLDNKANIVYIGNKDFELEKNLIKSKNMYKGQKSLLLSTGANGEFAIDASKDIAKEILQYEKKNKIKFDYIFFPVGTGGILYGLSLGKYICKCSWNLFGILIDDYDFKYYIKNCKHQNIELYKSKNELGYGKYSKNDLKQIEILKEKSNIYFDPVYTYKCLKAMIELYNQEKIKESSNVLMIHTGKN